MKKNIIIAFLFPIIILFCHSSQAETRYIEGFSSSQVGEFPSGWRTRPGQKGEAKRVYKIKEEDGNKYLSADDSNKISVQIFKMAHWDLEKYPYFVWKWRAKKLPKGANETIPSKNDSACGLYISFGLLRGNALKYVWSSTAPAGTKYKKNDKMYILVKESGKGSGKWKYEKTNIVEDAKKTFGKIPDRTLTGIAILTDGNATGTRAACDYDSIGFSDK